MIDIRDKNHQPDMAEITEYIDNPLFSDMCINMESEYKALVSVEYSGDNVLLGWNIRFRKSGRTLCRLYPMRGYFTVLVVIGRKEKERVEMLLPEMSQDVQEKYHSTKEGMGQRWLLIELRKNDAVFQDVLKLIAIRRESK